jgi:hypothetical protein
MSLRVLFGVIVLIVALYQLQRLMASNCTGAACDAYIPLSLLLPVSALILAAVTGGIAAYRARATGPVWVAVLGACAAIGSVGPVAAAFFIKDNEVLVSVSTVLVLTVPVSALAYTSLRPRNIG